MPVWTFVLYIELEVLMAHDTGCVIVVDRQLFILCSDYQI